MSARTPKTLGFILAFLGAILFSTKAILVKKAFAEIDTDALTLLATRMLFSLPFYVATAFWIGSKSEHVRLNTKQWLIIACLGVAGYYISSLLDFVGLQYVSAGLERLILFLYPTFVVLINAFVFKQSINGLQKAALFLTYLGIAIAYAGELQVDHDNPNLVYGSLLILLCAITYSIYIVGSGRMIPQVGATKFTAYAMLAATIGIFIHFLAAGNSPSLSRDPQLWQYGFMLAIIATVVPSFLISFGMKSIGANNVAIISSIGPVSTIIQAHYFLGEEIFTAQIIGTILVISGVLLIAWKR